MRAPAAGTNPTEPDIEAQAGSWLARWSIRSVDVRPVPRSLMLLLVAAILLVAGCGGEGTTSSDVTYSRHGLDGFSECLVAAKWKPVGEEEGTEGTTYTLDSPGGARVRFTTTVAGAGAPDGGYLIPDPEGGGLAVIVDEGSLTDAERAEIDGCASGDG